MSDRREAIRQLWLRNRETTVGRLARVRSALEQLRDGSLDDEEREAARIEAHRLRGILGSYGSPEGSVLAAEAEDLLVGGADASAAADLGLRLEAYAETL